jgi:uncharacterized membrane protein YesL
MFNPESLFWRMISRCVDIVGLSLLWAALSLPIVTCGAATSALYYTIVKSFRQNDRDTFHIYWDSFKSNLKQGLLVSILSGILLLALAYGYSIMKANWSTQIGQIMFVTYDILLVVPLGTLCYLFPIQGRFSLPSKLLLMNSFVLAMKHIFTTVILTLMVVESVIVTLEYWWPIFFLPVLTTLLASLFLEKIFEKYLSDDQKDKFNNKE